MGWFKKIYSWPIRILIMLGQQLFQVRQIHLHKLHSAYRLINLVLLVVFIYSIIRLLFALENIRVADQIIGQVGVTRS